MELVAFLVIAGIVGLFFGLRKGSQDAPPRLNQVPKPNPPATNSTAPLRPRQDQLVSHPLASPPRIASSSVSATKPTSHAPARWLSADDECEIQGIRIAGGLLYVGNSLSRIDGHGVEPALIVPDLPVRQGGLGDDMPYWPSYSELSPVSRGAYLQWLATGRKNPDANIGLIFLYFYGLERRAVAEVETVTEQDRECIRTEVRRLVGIYGEKASFRRYATEFLGMLDVTRANAEQLAEALPLVTKASESSNLQLRVGLGWMASTGKPIPSEWALGWVQSHENFYERMPAERCQREFEALFAFRYEERFGSGIVIKPNKTPFRAAYRPASASFGGELSLRVQDIPDVSASKLQIEKLIQLANECMDELDPYSRYLGRNPESGESPAALSLLPTPVIQERNHPALRRIADWVRAQPFSEELAIASFEDLRVVWPNLPDGKIAKRDAVLIANCVQRLGFGLEPDIRFGNHCIQSDEKLVLFRLPPDAPVAPSTSYTSCTLLAHLGAVMAHADNQVTIEEEQELMRHAAQNADLTAPERLRLRAYMKWLLLTPPEMTGLKKRMEALAPGDRVTLGSFLARLVGADGNIAPSEITALQKVYRHLDLDPESVFQDTHAAATEPVSVLPAQAVPAYQIPSSPLTKPTSRVNLDRIRVMETESEKVSVLLRGIFSDDAENVLTIPAASSSDHAVIVRILDLDAAHSQFASSLLVRDQWSRAELESLASSHRLMPDGAIDSLNEAALILHGELLLEGEDPIEINIQLRSMILT